MSTQSSALTIQPMHIVENNKDVSNWTSEPRCLCDKADWLNAEC